MVWRVHTKSCFRLLIMTKKLPPVFLIETKPCQHFSCVNYNFWQYYPELPSWGLQCDDNNMFNVLYSGCSCSIMTPTNGIWKERKKISSRFIFICLADNQQFYGYSNISHSSEIFITITFGWFWMNWLTITTTNATANTIKYKYNYKYHYNIYSDNTLINTHVYTTTNTN